MAQSTRKLRLEDLGPNQQAAVRVLLDDFRDHGWRDQGGGAIAAVRALASAARGLTTTRVAQAIPEVFFVRNSVTRTEVREALDELAASTRGR
jgi:hypothetical protein